MTLIERIEAAKAGSRELSDKCLLAVGWTREEYQNPGLSVDAGEPVMCWNWQPPEGKTYDWGWCNKNGLPDPSQNLQDCVDWLYSDVPEMVPSDPLKACVDALRKRYGND